MGSSGVVVGYDGSEFAVRALEWALDEAELRGLPLTVCHAWQPPRGADVGTVAAMRRAAERVVRQGAEWARARGLPVDIDLYQGAAADRLVELSATADLVVVGSCRPDASRGVTIGAVRRVVAGRARCPVIMVRDTGPARRSGPIAVGVNGNGDIDVVLAFACQEAMARRLPLVVVHAWQHQACHVRAVMPLEPAAVRAHAEERMTRVLVPWRLRYPNLLIEVSAAEGPARQELLEAALDATLLVVGAPESRCGSMTVFMLDHAPCPVAIVRTQEVAL
ncbi:universal stress protein [Thermopolyspora flexuosa]|uniref:Nucleotide-binding universal stress UspA family protein n=1 Tax=Thermopolyspora flexuosa TaxID=103836 RepID=A0A543IUH3_9ACTN|nr:universal stress protein [Thermopolyspora flexuosa]TQM74222.1 nucleotide-binding universal stress UspA family protein [Thermopolyspora flexuosa]GGM89478.1 universal stress protein [Thermopolyspora flexuosa]